MKETDLIMMKEEQENFYFIKLKSKDLKKKLKNKVIP